MGPEATGRGGTAELGQESQQYNWGAGDEGMPSRPDQAYLTWGFSPFSILLLPHFVLLHNASHSTPGGILSISSTGIPGVYWVFQML